MKTNHTDITIVLDRSGSMQVVAADTIGGFNRFIDEQRNAAGTATLTLHQFDTIYETVFAAKDVKTAPHLTTETFVPRGGTALLDAIGVALTETGKRLEKTPEQERAGAVVFVIITDGEENSSHEFNRETIFNMIAHQREKYHWQFVFLGANQDAIQTAQGMCISPANSMTYAHNTAGTKAAFAATSSNLRMFRAGEAQTMGYTQSDRDEQAKAGAV